MADEKRKRESEDGGGGSANQGGVEKALCKYIFNHIYTDTTFIVHTRMEINQHTVPCMLHTAKHSCMQAMRETNYCATI